MKKLVTLAGAGLLIAGQGAFAQDGAMSQGETAPEQAAPMEDAGDAFTDGEIEAYVGAIVELRDLQEDGTLDQEAANAVIAEAGIDAQTFNAIGEAVQTDPETAQRVQIAHGNLRGQPGA